MSAFKVFLSHRYESPETNLFFFRLFAEFAALQFEVDAGVSFKRITDGELVKKRPTNVTRLERMLREADAFIGIYPLPGLPTAVPTRENRLVTLIAANQRRLSGMNRELQFSRKKPSRSTTTRRR